MKNIQSLNLETPVNLRGEDFNGPMLSPDAPELATATPSMPVAATRALRALKATARRRRRGAAESNGKFSWAKAGAAIGVAIYAADLFLGRGAGFEGSDGAAGLWRIFDHIFATVVLTTFLFFVAGAIWDVVKGERPRARAVRKKASRPGIAASSKNWRKILAESRVRLADLNFVARHWRGELPLWISCWVIGVIGGIVVSFLPAVAIAVFTADKSYNPSSIFGLSVAVWVAVFAIAAWQAVGVWRSATHYAAASLSLPDQTGDAELAPLWSGLARLAVIAGLASLLATFHAEWLPQFGEMYKIAFHNDPDIPPYSIRITKNGTEAEIVGGFKYGLTDDFAAAAKKAPHLKVVRLDSAGGRLGEGENLFTLIRERGLSTYVASKCFSACTLAFAGGRERVLKRGAALGFHKGEFPGVNESEFDDLQYKVFSAAGFDDQFIERALSTPHSDLWTPSPEILLSAKVITGIADRTAMPRHTFAAQ